MAAFAMNQFQALWKDGGDEGGDDATIRAAAGISKTVFHHELTAAEKKWAGPAVHYAFGGLLGAAYGAMAGSNRLAAVGGGTGYGSAVWLLADEIGVPAAGLSDSTAKTPPMKHVQAWTSHLVYGLVTEGTRRAILRVLRVRW